ncbi:MAG TPA: magnesium-translocating P-type ATPase [Burkholderiaceae bacterium]|nr:magnesium-translocating P-type ATPase [Burkholderiaceae bacterium]
MTLDFLRELYVGFVRARAMTRHFSRFSLLDALRGAEVSRDVAPALSRRLLETAQQQPGRVLDDLGSHVDGLTESQAEDERDRVGPNEVGHEKPLPWWRHLWHCYRNPFSLLLTVLAGVSWYTEDVDGTVLIASMVVLSTLLRFVQETRSNRAADKLKEMVSNTATVLRRDPASLAAEEAARYFEARLHPKPPQRCEIPIKQIVPGDIIFLSAGDMVPADLRVLGAKDLFVSQAAMTGESMPVEKFPSHRGAASNNPLDYDNLLFMGTNVVSGSATAVAVMTGDRTYFGALARKVTATDRAPTAFQVGVNKVSWLLIRFMLVMSPVVLLINGFTKGNWTEALLFALSVAVGLTPEMLPMIVTSTLAKGAVFLSRKKVIVKRLEAIQNFGAMDVLCTDKTGTLTQDKIFLSRHTDAFGEDSDAVLEYAYLNSYYQTGLKNLLDVAVLEHAEVQRDLQVATAFRKIDEIPFDFNRRRMSVVVAEHDEHHLLICKGAVEEMLAICTRVRHGEADEPMTPEVLARVREVTGELNAEGLRVVAVGVKEMPPTQEIYGLADEAGLVLIGYIAFLDPPKESTTPALAALAAHGIAVKVLTGDNELVTTKICREVDFEVSGVLLGSAIEGMGEAELAAAVETNNVFAKLTPAHKERIVRALRSRGHITGFLGDGINDAPALRAADIGISVDSAVDIAKEAADIILLERSLLILEGGVQEGRRTFSNMLKYIKMAASSNFGNVFSVLVASVFLPFLPMLPAQLLTQNLLYDISQIAIPFDNVDAELVEKPQHWRADDLGRFMVFFGPISSIFDIATFALMWFVFGARSEAQQSVFQAGWFIEGLATQTLIVHMIRTAKLPFIESRPAAALALTTLAVVALGVFVAVGPLAADFKFARLPAAYYPCVAAFVLCYIALTQWLKRFYVRRWGWS